MKTKNACVIVLATVTGLSLSVFILAAEKNISTDYEERKLHVSTSQYSTLLKEAKQLELTGHIKKAMNKYHELIISHQELDQLAASAWLSYARLQILLNEKDAAIKSFHGVMSRFGHVPWATKEASEHLRKLHIEMDIPQKGNMEKFAERNQSISSTQIQGKINTQGVFMVIKNHLTDINYCMKNTPGINMRRRIIVQWRIGIKGNVVEAKIIKGGKGVEEVTKCILEKILLWKFQKPQDDNDVVVTMPLTIR